MKSLDRYPLAELKHIYLTLHGQLQNDMELMDSELLHDLQAWLQTKAREDGVDVSVHAQWTAWLHGGKPVSCA